MKKLIFGLGNPGKEYQMLRHNIGARVVSIFKKDKNIFEDVVIALPTTFVNESGKAVKSLMEKYKIPANFLLLVHDDSDIAFGKFKLSFGSRSAGHRGVESVINSLGTKDFWRLRIGIQPQGYSHHIKAEELVLKPFRPEEENELPRIIEAAIAAIEAWIEKVSK